MELDREIFGEEDPLPPEFETYTAEAISQRARLLDNEIRVLKDESTRLGLEVTMHKEKIKENKEKIKLNNQLPYLVSNIVEVLDIKPEEDEEEDGANIDLDAQRKVRVQPSQQSADAQLALAAPGSGTGTAGRARFCADARCSRARPFARKVSASACVSLPARSQGKCVVLKTTTRQTIFLPVVGLVDANALRPGDLVGVNKDSYLVLDTLPAEYDSRVKAMEVDEKPKEDFSDVGGLDKQIQELVEAIVLPIKHKDKFTTLGIKPPKVRGSRHASASSCCSLDAHRTPRDLCGSQQKDCCVALSKHTATRLPGVSRTAAGNSRLQLSVFRRVERVG